MPLEVPPPRSSRFGSPFVLNCVHWVRPELIAEVKFLTWTEENLLRQGRLRRFADKPARSAPPCTGGTFACWTDVELARPAQAKEDEEGQS
jgi:hypothetical protein